jgi:hypothetical protein
MVTVHIYVQNMTLDEFKNELDGKLEKVLTMKYYLTKLYKGGSASRNRDNIDTSSTAVLIRPFLQGAPIAVWSLRRIQMGRLAGNVAAVRLSRRGKT